MPLPELNTTSMCMSAAMHLSQPMGKRHIDLIARTLEGCQRARHVLLSKHDVEILRLALAPRIPGVRESAADEKRHCRRLEQPQRIDEEGREGIAWRRHGRGMHRSLEPA